MKQHAHKYNKTLTPINTYEETEVQLYTYITINSTCTWKKQIACLVSKSGYRTSKQQLHARVHYQCFSFQNTCHLSTRPCRWCQAKTKTVSKRRRNFQFCGIAVSTRPKQHPRAQPWHQAAPHLAPNLAPLKSKPGATTSPSSRPRHGAGMNISRHDVLVKRKKLPKNLRTDRIGSAEVQQRFVEGNHLRNAIGLNASRRPTCPRTDPGLNGMTVDSDDDRTNVWTDGHDLFLPCPRPVSSVSLSLGCEDWRRRSPNNKKGHSNMSQALQGFFTRVIPRHPRRQTSRVHGVFQDLPDSDQNQHPKIQPGHRAPPLRHPKQHTKQPKNPAGTKHLPYSNQTSTQNNPTVAPSTSLMRSKNPYM